MTAKDMLAPHSYGVSMSGSREEFEKIERAVGLAISHILQKGCDDIFKPPSFAKSPEADVISQHEKDFKKKAHKDTIKFLQAADLNKIPIGLAISSLVSKDEHTFRQVSWIDPFDSVKFLALAILLFDTIETKRIPKAENILHSHRRSEEKDKLFDDEYGYDSFRKASALKSKQRLGQWKVITDISNFFDRIGNHSLENHLIEIECEHKYVELMRDVLLFWTEGRRSFGVPVGSDASRILAEAALIGVDKKLQKNGVDFIRYVDDYRIFADTKPKASWAVQVLTAALAEEGLQLNSKKTKIQLIVETDELANVANTLVGGEHQKINLEEKKEVIARSQVSGRTNISRYYKEPGKEAWKKIRELSQQQLLEDFEKSTEQNIEQEIKQLVKFFIYSEKQDATILRTIIERRITAIIYIADALTKEVERFSEDKCDEICKQVFDVWRWEDCAYPLVLAVLRIAALSEFRRPSYIEYIVENQKQIENYVFLREAILLGASNLERARVRNLAIEVFPNVSDFVQRAIFVAVKNHPTMADDEKRPLLKNLKLQSTDWFIERL